MYEEEKEYNVLKGQIPDFGYDVKFAVTVDGQKSSIPGRQDNSGNYYNVKVSCENGTTVGEWDYNAWNVKLDDISDGSKCTLAFTGGMSKEDYQKYIEQGVSTRRNTYRGKELTLDNDFWTSIQNGTFDDIYVGDYIKSPNSKKDIYDQDVIWLVADIDNYLYTGNDIRILTKHHLTIIPAVPLMNAPMNDSNTTTGGYKGSRMVTETLDQVYNSYIQPDFGDEHVIKYSSSLTNAINESGVSSGIEWVTDRKLDLMSEVNVFGATYLSSSYMDVETDMNQYAIFHLKPELINSYGTKRFRYWLKGILNTRDFLRVYEFRISSSSPANDNFTSVRPRFLIG